MSSLISFNASTRTPQEVADIPRDYLALDRVRFWRRLLAARFGGLALAVFVAGRIIPGLSAYGHWIPLLICLAPPAWAWIAEFRLARQLSRRLHWSPRDRSDTVAMESASVETDL